MATKTTAATDLPLNDLIPAHEIKHLREKIDPQQLHIK